jgi:hypothetical protein
MNQSTWPRLLELFYIIADTDRIGSDGDRNIVVRRDKGYLVVSGTHRLIREVRHQLRYIKFGLEFFNTVDKLAPCDTFTHPVLSKLSLRCTPISLLLTNQTEFSR